MPTLGHPRVFCLGRNLLRGGEKSEKREDLEKASVGRAEFCDHRDYACTRCGCLCGIEPVCAAGRGDTEF